MPRVRARTKKQFRQLQNRCCGNTQRLRAARGVDAMAVRQPLDAIAAAPRARACLVLACCLLIRCCPVGSRWSSGGAARRGQDRQRSHRARWATTSRAYAGRRRWTRLVGAHIDSAPPRLDSDNQAAVDVFNCDVVSVNAVLADLRSPCSKTRKTRHKRPEPFPLNKNTARKPHGPQLRLLRQRYICSDTWRNRERVLRAEGTCSCILQHIWPLCASALARTPAVAARQAPADSRTLNHCCCAADDTSFSVAPIETQPLDAAAAHKNTSAVTHAFADAGSMPQGKKRGSTLPPGQLSAATRTKVERSIELQRKAIEAQYGGPTKLLPRAHKGFFASIDASNVDDESLLSISLEDLPSDKVFYEDGGRGTSRKAVQQYLKDRLARAAKPDAAGALTAKRAKLREEGKLDFEFADLDDDARKNAWRKLLVIPGSCELAVGQREFVKRTGGSGSYFWSELSRERAAAMADEARGRGDLWASTRERAHTAS